MPVEETLPKLLNDEGYQTKVVGKMHVFPERCHYGFETMLLCEEGRLLGQYEGENRGYDDYEQWLADQGYPGQAMAHGMSVNEYAMTPWHLPNHLHPTEWIGTQACREIKSRDWTRPLFLWASFTAPHPPLTPLLNDLYLYEKEEMPEPAVGEWADEQPAFHTANLSFGEEKTEKQISLAKQAYYASVTHVDRQINRILGTLREEGLLENTWFIFTSDHGDNLGDHHLWQKANFLKGACNIPLIITPPLSGEYDHILGEDWLPGKVNHSVVGLHDILPTCLDISKATVPDHVDGTSLIPLVQNPKQSVRENILGEFGHIGERSLMLTDGIWKYIWYEEDGFELLFNLKEDPDEVHNLANSALTKKEELRKSLIDILSVRDNDPAVVGNELRVTTPGRKVTEKEKVKLINIEWAYNHPHGLH